MNEQDFYQTLATQRAAHQTPASMSSRIDDGIRATTKRRQVQTRRLVWGLSLSVAVAIVAGYPSVSAYATVSKLRRAIEQVPNVHVVTKVVLADGSTQQGDSIYYRKGETAYVSHSGLLISLSNDQTAWFWDPSLKAYVRQPAKGVGMQSLSELLQPSGPLGLGSGCKIELFVEGGKQKLKAVVKNPNLNERYTFVASAATDLIESYVVEGKAGGKWTPKLLGQVDYPKSQDFPALPPRSSVLDENDAQTARVQAIGANILAESKIGASTVAIRKVELSESGLVFVVYQSGNKDALNDPHSSTWRGYATQLSDNLKTTYVHVGDMIQLKHVDAARPELGMFECEIFAPAEPLVGARPTRFSIGSFEDGDRKLARLVFGYSVYDDGTFKGNWVPQNAKFHPILTDYRIEQTQVAPPSWLTSFNVRPDEIEMMVARWRAMYYTGEQNWGRAEAHQLEAIRLSKEWEAKTRMPRDHSQLEQKLESIRKHSFRD